MTRWRFIRDVLGCGLITSAFILFINATSNLPPHKVGFMFCVWDMNDYITPQQDDTTSEQLDQD